MGIRCNLQQERKKKNNHRSLIQLIEDSYKFDSLSLISTGHLKAEYQFHCQWQAEATKRHAVATGGNKGIGFEICRQLASKGIVVVLTARDEKRGLEAARKLEESGLGNLIVFHQLDVADIASMTALADFVKSQFGKLDILMNNAGVSGTIVDPNNLKVEVDKVIITGSNVDWSTVVKRETSELAEECLTINYYGAKRTCEALLPLLQLSDSPVIVNVSSSMGKLKNVTNEWAKRVLADAENLTEDRVDEVLKEYLKDFAEGSRRAEGWPAYHSAYILSKAALNGYTRILAKKYPGLCINCVCPAYVKIDINHNNGILTAERC